MKVLHNNLFQTVFLALLLALMTTACNKPKEEVLDLPRHFMPGNITILAGETAAEISWRPSLFADGDVPYIVEISTDTLFGGTPHLVLNTNVPMLTVTDSELEIETRYFVRVKTGSKNGTDESGWVYSESFMITGEQIFNPIMDPELKDKSVIVRWRPSPGLTKIILTQQGGTPVEIMLEENDLEEGFKLIPGLTPETMYTAAIFAGNLRKGFLTFTTKELSIYAVLLSPGDNLINAIDAAADGDLIGLEPGTYNAVNEEGEFANIIILKKNISLVSVSDNPANTIVNFRELTLKGTGAGIRVRGIHFDGLAAGSNSLYFLNLTGENSDSEDANFAGIEVDNCIVTNMGNCFLRGNRGSSSVGHKIEFIKVNNSIVQDSRYLNAYTFFTIDKLGFKTLQLTNSTFNRLGRAFIGYSTNITVDAVPQIIIENCTINSFGRDNRNNFFVDANANQLNLLIQNSIIANTPMENQTTGSNLIRGTIATGSMFNTNYFNLSTGGETPVDLSWPDFLQQMNNRTVNLGWTQSTNDFTLPADSELRTASSTGGPIGDPRWAF